MILDPMAITQTRARLIQTPGWDKMSAYERTMVCCRELTRCSYAIPGWSTLREIIEKGSGSDISRAKTDYQVELAGQVIHAEAESVALNLDLPPSISGLFEELWRKAVKEAGIAFGKRKVEIELELEQNQFELEQERTNAKQAVDQSNKLSLEVHTLKQQLQDSLRQNTILQAERDQTEKLLSEGHEAVRFQTERADLIHTNSQKQIREALDRLEGVENHSLREVERARFEANALVEEAALASTRSIDAFKKRVEELKQKITALSEAATTAKIEAEFFQRQYQELSGSIAAQQNDISSALKNISSNLEEKNNSAKRRPTRSTSKSATQKSTRPPKKLST